MEATAAAANLLRPAARRCVTSTRTALKHQVRAKATSARTRRALNIPPHPSFLSTDPKLLDGDTIIFNPPSSAASVYHTPFKFLPKTDPRRRANLASLFESHFNTATATATASVAAAAVPAAVDASHMGPVVMPKPEFADRPPVTKAEVEEMRQLRHDDPHRWNVKALSDKYQIPQSFVMACCQAPKEKIEFERKKLELVARRWGAAKRKAKEDKERRREMLYRGEI